MFQIPQNWQTYALGSAFFAGLTGILVKLGVQNINSNMATFLRTAVVLVMSFFIVTYRGEWQRLDKLDSKSVVFLILSGIATGFSWLLYFKALNLGPVSKVVPVDKLSVVFAILFSVFILGEALTWQVIIGGAFILIGSLIIAFK